MRQDRFRRRLDTLEATLHRQLNPPCATCKGLAMREAFVDPSTEIVWEETLPETGCPDCGAPIFHEYIIMLPQFEGDEGTDQ